MPCVSRYRQLKCDFSPPSLVVPPDPSLTICLTCLIIGNVVEIMGGSLLTTNYLTQSDLGEVERLGWTDRGLIPIPTKQASVSSFIVTIVTTESLIPLKA